MKHFIVVSCGRCGTVRLAQILRDKLPAESYAVVHQMNFSRLANVVGNLLYSVNAGDRMKETLYPAIVEPYRRGRHLVVTDPLTAMIVPPSLLARQDTFIVHVQRDHDEFARSMVAWSRKRGPSRIAHNLVPFWQPGLAPLENLILRRPHKKYRQISVVKNRFFSETYGSLENYIRVDMRDLFAADRLAHLIWATLRENIAISADELKRKANAS